MPSVRKKLNFPLYVGLFLVTTCLVLLAVVFYPGLKSEFSYLVAKPDAGLNVTVYSVSSDPATPGVIVAKDKDFSIVIPKIGANAKVIANVDPASSKEYQTALTQGVAHAKGTATPDQPGNTFLFAHSSDSFFNANTFNAVFYLLNKLQPDDSFFIAYKAKLYEYKVVKTQIVSPTDINYYAKTQTGASHTATLMTCWPPATTLKRLVVVGSLR